VEENLRAAAWQRRRQEGGADERVNGTLDRFEVLADRRHDRAGDLSGGQQQMLALAMALLAAPKLLMIDELSLGLAPIVVEQLLDSVRALKDGGTAVLLVEQSVTVAVSVADRVYVMDSGAIRFSGAAAEVRDRPELLWSIYVHHAAAGVAAELVPAPPRSGAVGLRARRGAPPKGAGPNGAGPRWALEVAGASVTFGGINALDAVTLSVAPGEVVGIIGPNGAGKTTLFDVISGFTRARAGRVSVYGTDVTALSAGGRARLGLGRSFQDSRLFSALSVRDTLAVALERFVDTGGPVNAALRLPVMVDTEAAVDARVEELVELFGLGRFADKFVSELSTGTRRLVDLAAVVAHAPTVVLLDEPSSGVAQREVEAMGELLKNVRRRLDATLVVVEHDIAFVAELSDRLVALDRGRVLAEGVPADVLARADVVEAFLGNNPSTWAPAGETAPAVADALSGSGSGRTGEGDR
jgi:branched-chain amino acid transport system ATP-binding protein